MRRFLSSVVLAAALLAAGLPAATPAAAVVSCPQRVMLVGDSITNLQGDFPRLRELLTQAGCVQTQLYNASAGGRGTSEVTVAAPFLASAIHPDLIIYMIGTNDDPTGFESRYSASLQAFRDWAGTAVRILPSINQCPQTPPAPAWISMPAKNNAIYRASYDMVNNRFKPNVVGFVSLDKVPPAYMGPDGFHPTPDGLIKHQEQEYRAIAAAYGLLPIPPDPALTGSCS